MSCNSLGILAGFRRLEMPLLIIPPSLRLSSCIHGIRISVVLSQEHSWLDVASVTLASSQQLEAKH